LFPHYAQSLDKISEDPMPTLRRILKYMPAAVMGLLVVAWVVSVASSYALSFSVPFSEWQYAAGGHEGALLINYQRRVPSMRFYWYEQETRGSPATSLGQFNAHGFVSKDSRAYWQVEVPFLALITAVLPFAVGSFTAFRFRLCHYLAYTVLAAVELAYYLRWQE
jgi:hypothetical protein